MTDTPQSLSLHSLLEKSARHALGGQRDDGSFRAGTNGLYGDLDTPVRNTAHWLCLLAAVFENTKDPIFGNAATRSLEYLLQPELRPSGGTFTCRRTAGKDRCNGLIGQAWAIEGLVAGAKCSQDDVLGREAAELASYLVELHPFDEHSGLWSRVEDSGEELGFDWTLNHQLWFAYAGSLVTNSTVMADRVDAFLGRLPSLMRVTRSGRIRHPVARRPRPYLNALRLVRDLMRSTSSSEKAARREIGYHTFNMYALAGLNLAYPHHEFWRSPLVSRALTYMQSSQFAQDIESNEYGYPYNPPGFEAAYALHVLVPDGGIELQGIWLEKQIRRTVDLRTGLMDQGTLDPFTLAARMYEASRLPNMRLAV